MPKISLDHQSLRIRFLPTDEIGRGYGIKSFSSDCDKLYFTDGDLKPRKITNSTSYEIQFRTNLENKYRFGPVDVDDISDCLELPPLYMRPLPSPTKDAEITHNVQEMFDEAIEYRFELMMKNSFSVHDVVNQIRATISSDYTRPFVINALNEMNVAFKSGVGYYIK